MKRFFVAALCMTLSPAYTLDPGNRYNFYQDNGQNLLGAELVEENETHYTVKLKYLPKPLRIAKKNLLCPPEQLESRQSSDFRWGRELRGNLQLGYSALTTGELRQIFRSGYHAAVGVDWHLFPEPRYGIAALSLLAGFSGYSQMSREIRQFSIHAGPRFTLFHWKKTDILFSASALGGLSFVALKGYTFSANYRAFSATGTLRAEKSFSQVILGVQFFLNYLFDQSLNFTASGLGFSVQYQLVGP